MYLKLTNYFEREKKFAGDKLNVVYFIISQCDQFVLSSLEKKIL
jgi:hypothetical protein